MFFKYNTQLGPPYRVLVDTNFINFSIKNKIDLVAGMMECLYAQCTPCVTDCVLAELEKLGQKYRVALRVAKDPRVERLPCSHGGTYADDCLVQRVQQHKCYIVATCDRDLRRRIRKVGVFGVFVCCWCLFWCFRGEVCASLCVCVFVGVGGGVCVSMCGVFLLLCMRARTNQTSSNKQQQREGADYTFFVRDSCRQNTFWRANLPWLPTVNNL
jgi:rRNA-processing protein FCF1